MKKKVLTNTYLREATKYQIKLFLDEDDMFVSVKRLIKVTDKFIIRHGIVAMDNGYYIIEMIPKKDNYALRIFLDDKKKIIEYYFDIIKNSGIDEEYKVPYFNDLYVDITLLAKTGEVNVLDEEEFIDAYKHGDIDKKDYDLVVKMKKRLLKEIKEGTNKLLNVDLSKYLDNF